MSGLTAAGEPEEPGRSALALLLDRNVGPFIVGKTLSACGHWTEQLAAAVLMYELTRSALAVGLVGAVQFAAPLVLALWSGALSDRHDRRRVLLTGRLISGLGCLVLAVLVLLRGTRDFGGEPVLLVSVAVMGVGHAIASPAMQALVHDLVPRRDLEGVLALNSISPSLARTVGPAAGAGLLVLGGPGLAFAATAGAHLLFVVVLVFIRPLARDVAGGRNDLFAGLRYVVRDRSTALLLLGVVVVGFGSDPILTLGPKLAESVGGAGVVGLFVAAYGVGAVLVTVSFRGLRRWLSLRAATGAGLLAQGAGLVIVAMVPTRAGILAGFVVAGSGYMLATVSITTRLQRRIPDEVRGRVLALWSVAFFGARPLIAPVNGSIADAAGTRAALLVVAGVVMASCFVVAARDDPRP